MVTRSQTEEITKLVKQVASESVLCEEFLNKIVSAVSLRVSEIFEEKISKFQKDLKVLQQQLVRKDEQITSLSEEVDRLHQYSRRNCLRITGVPEKKNESTDQVVLQVFQDKLNVSLDPAAIDRSHRLGKHPQGKDKCRPLIVKFTRYNDRALVYSHKRKLKNTGITIKEDLTQNRLAVINAAIKKYGFRSTWSRDGVICVKIKDSVHRITSMGEFNNLAE